MGKMSKVSLSLMLVLLLYACDTRQTDGVDADKVSIIGGSEQLLPNGEKLEGYTNFLELSSLQDLGIKKPHGVGLEILRATSISPEYGLLKELKDGIISEANSETVDYTLSNVVAEYTYTSDNGNKELTTTNLSLDEVIDYSYTQVFESLEDYEENKLKYDDIIHMDTSDWVVSELVISTPAMSGTQEYKIYSKGLKHIAVLSSNDSFGRYVLNIRYIIADNIEYYLKAEYPRSATLDGVLSIGNLGVYIKSNPTDLYTEDFIPLLATALSIPLEDFIITDEGIVQETQYESDTNYLRILSEDGLVVGAEVTPTYTDLSLDELNSIVDKLVKTFGMSSGSRAFLKDAYDITTYVKGDTTMIFSRSLLVGSPSKIYFLNRVESNRLIEYQILRKLGASYMDYR